MASKQFWEETITAIKSLSDDEFMTILHECGYDKLPNIIEAEKLDSPSLHFTVSVHLSKSLMGNRLGTGAGKHISSLKKQINKIHISNGSNAVGISDANSVEAA